jgi:hypothetical protein
MGGITMLPIGTTVQRVNSPNSGRVGVIAGEQVPNVNTYPVSFDEGRPQQYWSPKYFKVLKLFAPDWEV